MITSEEIKRLDAILEQAQADLDCIQDALSGNKPRWQIVEDARIAAERIRMSMVFVDETLQRETWNNNPDDRILIDQ